MLTFIVFTLLTNILQIAFVFSATKLKNISWLFYALMCYCYSYGFFNYDFTIIFILNLLLATIGYINFSNNTSIRKTYTKILLIVIISILLIYITLTKDLIINANLLTSSTDISFLYLKFIFDSLEVFGYVLLVFRYFYGIIFISLKALWFVLSCFPYMVISHNHITTMTMINFCFAILLISIVIFQFKKARKLYSSKHNSVT